ncbi:MAG: hypothetical protein AVDCRST_MAG36-1014 [uncultured Nocardioidaceae bacterium]|uniref:CmpX n=1 Tax=uncultured Nocardioidaceae bacterium TaxID=253824 RepID=A0A6J4LHU8_9ACTN|nr:MAG: hypothetical protein AVDCRST_MAG36-1014 [uncultured Nocardioidaceae bacterium]
MRIEQSLQNAFDAFFRFLPNLIGFLVLLIIGFIVAKVVAGIVRKLLEKVGVDRHLQNAGPHNYVERFLPGASVSKAVSKVVFWLIFVFFLFAAVGALKIPAVTTFMNQVLAYLPNIIVAIGIFVIAALIAGAVAGAVGKLMGDTPTGKIVATVVPSLVMVIALFMILEQLQIAPEIVRIAFGATMFAIALGLALAFGLGGRTVAQRLLEDAYSKGQQQRGQVAADIAAGKERAQGAAQQAGGSSSSGSSSDAQTQVISTGQTQPRADGGSSRY